MANKASTPTTGGWRLKVADRGLTLAERIVAVEQEQRFYDAIVEFILAHVPAKSQPGVIRELEALNAEGK